MLAIGIGLELKDSEIVMYISMLKDRYEIECTYTKSNCMISQCMTSQCSHTKGHRNRNVAMPTDGVSPRNGEMGEKVNIVIYCDSIRANGFPHASRI